MAQEMKMKKLVKAFLFSHLPPAPVNEVLTDFFKPNLKKRDKVNYRSACVRVTKASGGNYLRKLKSRTYPGPGGNDARCSKTSGRKSLIYCHNLSEFLENKPPQHKIQAEETKCVNNHAATLCKTQYKV